jgi:hypothetical protein
MLAPNIPLRMIAAYKRVDFPPEGSTIEERKKALMTALDNCIITRDIGTEQMNEIAEAGLADDVHAMRKEALIGIQQINSALKAKSEEDFNRIEGEIRTQYGNLIRSVKSFLWDAGPASKRYLWPFVEEVM